MLFVAVFSYSLGIASVFGHFLPTINNSSFSQVSLVLFSLFLLFPLLRLFLSNLLLA